MAAYDTRNSAPVQTTRSSFTINYNSRKSSPVQSIRQSSTINYNTRQSKAPAVTKYIMRGKKISDSQFVVWMVTDQPDTAGTFSGFAGNITDIVITKIIAC